MGNLNINQREKPTHHEARKNRKAGRIPGILYGKAIQNTMIEIASLELNEYLYNEGATGIVNVCLDGNEHKAIIKEVQRDAITRDIVHIDLEKVEANSTVTASVPVSFTGEENLVRHGVVLQKQKDSVKVKCEADNIPKVISLDVTNAKIGDSFRLTDVEFASEICIVDSLDSVLATVSAEQKRQDPIVAEVVPETQAEEIVEE
ncbi:50S ribosomal protein L25 [uncultured Clostridium sp.]|uniref:50S ribosomal protein L25 n=1 Tax=uncultured Clostridium sp. TaxID=59620 RepID=UPI002637AB60|nr:50S ribosomal protein L25 [uncultured Clostridium sp.]